MARWSAWVVVLVACSSRTERTPPPAPPAPEPSVAALAGALPVTLPALAVELSEPVSSSLFLVAPERGPLALGRFGVTPLAAGQPVSEGSLADDLDALSGDAKPRRSDAQWAVRVAWESSGPVDAVLLSDPHAMLAPIVDAISELDGRRIGLGVTTDAGVRRARYVLTAVAPHDVPRVQLQIDSIEVTADSRQSRSITPVAWSSLQRGFGPLLEMAAQGMPFGRALTVVVRPDARVEHLVALLDAAEHAGVLDLELQREPPSIGSRVYWGMERQAKIEIGVADPAAHAALEERWGQLYACYRARAAGRTSLYVELGLQLALPAAGGSADTVSIDTGDPGIARCVQRVLASIRYPAPAAGAGAMAVTIKFVPSAYQDDPPEGAPRPPHPGPPGGPKKKRGGRGPAKTPPGET
ncbi:MAG: hypothetical protein IPQ07_08950 [Myxococcales bacterium]|nr:hypothetical protein [Myxococcales bacterium]